VRDARRRACIRFDRNKMRRNLGDADATAYIRMQTTFTHRSSIMTAITLKGNTIHTAGSLPAVGSKAPDFKLTQSDLSDVSLKDFAGKKVVLNIFPSIDTGVCAMSVRKFNAEASELPGVVVVGVSKDLPFALKRFCGAEGIDKVVTTSALRDDASFGKDYGVTILDGGLAGLFSRAVVVVDEQGKVAYTEQVPEIGQEPDYEKALAAVK
jgi:thiol peroxidase